MALMIDELIFDRPLVVDLDGTLILTDVLHESALQFVHQNPFGVWHMLTWLQQGKAVLKRRLAENSDFNAASLPYNEPLLEWLKSQRQLGRRLILCTASEMAVAAKIAAHLGVFDDVMASDGVTNLAGAAKARALDQRFGVGGYDYAGNSSADLKVWQNSHRAIVVNASAGVAGKAAAMGTVERVFEPQRTGLAIWFKLLRVHQWMKNVLLFVPTIAAHQISSPGAWLMLVAAFFSFSTCASAVYIANDLADIESDRQHPRKKRRPFASGAAPVLLGVLVAPVLLCISIVLSRFAAPGFLPWLSFYFLVTCAYSWGLKRLVLVDCLLLAMLYTLRIVAGAAAVNLPLSFWLLAFAVFLFLSLAFVKRYAELQVQLLRGTSKLHGRGYHTSDAPLVQMLGIAAGYGSAMILALYLNSDAVVRLYKAPEVIWAAVPLMLYWVSWMWLQAHRGNMHDDPVVFAVKDWSSRLAGVLFATVVVIGAVGLPW